MTRPARRCGALAVLLLVSAVAACSTDENTMTCKYYRAAGTGSVPSDSQAAVIKAHINTDVAEPGLEVSLAHMATIYWCNKRNAGGGYVRDDDPVGDFLDDWK